MGLVHKVPPLECTIHVAKQQRKGNDGSYCDTARGVYGCVVEVLGDCVGVIQC